MTNDQDKHIPGFGEFEPQRVRIVTLKRLLVLFACGLVFAVVVGTVVKVASKGVERSAPELAISPLVSALNRDAVELHATALDDGSGVSSMSVVLRQGDQEKVLLDKTFARVHEVAETLRLDPIQLGLQQGPALLVVQSTDDAIWGNASALEVPLVVDFEAPKVEVVYVSPEITEGGTGLVVYRASDANLLDSGVVVGQNLFPGVPAGTFDPDFTAPDLYVSLFAAVSDTFSFKIGSSSKVEAGDFILRAHDLTGAATDQQLPTKLLARPAAKRQTIGASLGAIEQLSRAVLTTGLKDLNDREQKQAALLISAPQSPDMEKGGSPAARLALETLGPSSLRRISEILSQYSREERRFGDRPRVDLFTTRVAYGDEIVFSGASGPIASMRSPGVMFEPVGPASDVVIAPFGGVVRYAQALGPFGTTVVVDHGVGVATMLYSLQNTSVEWGGVVDGGQTVGILGASGVVVGKELRLLILVRGVPVDPMEWLNGHRFSEVISAPIRAAKQKLGIKQDPMGTRL